jgi:hypothetical protein
MMTKFIFFAPESFYFAPKSLSLALNPITKSFQTSNSKTIQIITLSLNVTPTPCTTAPQLIRWTAIRTRNNQATHPLNPSSTPAVQFYNNYYQTQNQSVLSAYSKVLAIDTNKLFIEI